MAKLTTAAIIVIVIVACLAAVSLGAALTKQLNPTQPQGLRNYPLEQERYMRSVRLKNWGVFHRDSAPPGPRDVESVCMFPGVQVMLLCGAGLG